MSSLLELAKQRTIRNKNKEIETENLKENLIQEIIDFLNSNDDFVAKCRELDETFKYIKRVEGSSTLDKIATILRDSHLLYPDIEHRQFIGDEYKGIRYNASVRPPYQKFISLTFNERETTVGYKKHFFKKIPITKTETYLTFYSRYYDTVKSLNANMESAKQAMLKIDQTIHHLQHLLKDGLPTDNEEYEEI